MLGGCEEDGGGRKHVEGVGREVVDQPEPADLPRGSFGKAEKIGDVAAFLCSERASLVVGACLNVDGGQSRTLF